MKKFFFAALAAFALLAVSCDKDTEINESALVGPTWYMPGEDYHPSIVTLNKNGTYTWEYGGITGMKDTGTYTIEGSVVTMKIADFWDIDTEWIDGVPTYTGEWIKQDSERTRDLPKTRTATVLFVDDNLLIWEIRNDWFFAGDGSLVLFMSTDKDELHIDRAVTKNDLQGEWEARDPEGALSSRLIISDNNYTLYRHMTNYDGETYHDFVDKYVGSFSLEGVTVTVNYDMIYSSMLYDYIDGAWVQDFAEYNPATLEANEWISESEQGYSDTFYVFRSGENLIWAAGYSGAAYKKKK